ncbi:MAG: glycosyltransferase family 4 protein [Pseudonocardiaceae bacterium]
MLVLEGMPGAGKTTAATALAAENWTVVGEYTSPTGAIIPTEAHPALDDDTAHQHNWLRKHHQVQAARRDGPVFCDRDWLSALAYAYSVMDDGELLSKRARWVSDHLDRGNLALASSYVLFQLDPRISLRRRADHLTPGHPWSSLPGLVRLAAYYRDPAEALVPARATGSGRPSVRRHLALAARLHSRPHCPLSPRSGRSPMTRPQRPTVVVALPDGFYGCGTGAGHSNRALLTIRAGLLPTEAQLVVLPVRLDSTSPEHDPTWHTETTTLLANVDSTVHPVDNGTAGQVRSSGLNCFRNAVRHAADILTHCVLPDAGPVLILALDAPFLGLAPFLPIHAVANLVLVPRSTARIHCPTELERIVWESHGLRTATGHGGRIAAISAYLRAHLTINYQVPDDAVVDLPNGLSPADWQLTAPDDSMLPVPARDGFMLAMGRAQPYKGFDDLLDALTLLHSQGVALPHLVLAAVTDNSEPSAYQQHLAKKITGLRTNATLLTHFHPDIRRLLAHSALCGVVVPSRAEPFGRVPIEAYAAGATPVITTTTGGLAEQVIDGRTGFTATPEDPASLAAVVQRALALTSAERHRIRVEARRFAASRYDYPDAVRSFLDRVAPWLDRQPGDSQST